MRIWDNIDTSDRVYVPPIAPSSIDCPMPRYFDMYRFRLLGELLSDTLRYRPAAFAALVYMSLVSIPLSAANSASYIESQARFAEISNPRQQAEAWAVCAAAYDVMSTIMRASSPERSRQLHNLANGAQVSIGMALVSAQIDADTDAARFGELWAANEAAMVDLPQQKLADILEDGEAMGDERPEDFGRKINATVFTCIDNLDTQRDYIDSWQAFAKQGVVEAPED